MTRWQLATKPLDNKCRNITYIHDPFFAQARIGMSIIEFEAGWVESKGLYALIGLAPG